MPRLRPRGPEPGRGRRGRVVALPAFPGLGVTAAFVPGTSLAAELDAPGLDVSARPSGFALAVAPAFPGLAVAARGSAGTQAAATVAFPGLTTRAGFLAALAAMRGLDVPKAVVTGLPPAAVLALPGLAVPRAVVQAIPLTPLAATLAVPGLSVAALATPPAGQFRLATDYRLDWAKLQNLVAPSVVQIGGPPSTGVRMSGKPTGPELTGNVALASKNKSGPGWSGAFTLKRTDAFAPASGGGGAFLILYFGAVGDGTAGFPADIAQWPATTEPATGTFASHITGARLSFFFNNFALGIDPVASVPALAVFHADGTVTAIAADGSPAGLNQARNFPFVYTLALSTAATPVLTLTQFDASTGVTRTITWTSALLGTRASPSQGSFAWLCTPGRVVEITAESFTPPVTPQASATLLLPGLDVPRAQVDPGAVGGVFPNGYGAVRRLVRSAQADLAAESTAGLPSFIDTTEIPGDWSFLLTSSAALLSPLVGGFPADVRLETEGGTKLDHDWVSYDGTAGTARLFVREPTGSMSDADLRVLLYYGKAGLGASEENVAGVWQAAALVIDPTTGADLTGGGRAFTRTGTLTNTTLDGRPATLFSAAGFLRRTNADLTFLEGLTALSETFWLKCPGTADGNISRLGGSAGPPPTQQVNSRFATWVEAIGSTPGAKAHVLEAGANWWGADLAQHNEYTESIANAADGTTTRHLIVVRQSNTHTALYDGETSISSPDFQGAPSAGTIHPRTDDNYSLGAGTGAQDTSPAMTLGLYVLWARALSATWRAMLDRTQRDSSLCWAVGAEDTFHNADNSPVGRPWRDSISATTDYVIASHAFDPDAGAVLAATAVTPASDTLAAYSIPAGRLRVAPVAGGPAGVARPLVTFGDGAKTAKVKPYIAITGGGPPPPGGAEGLATPFPTAAQQGTVIGPVAISALQGTYNNLSAAQIAAGVTILVTPGGTLAGGLTLGKDGLRGTGTELAPQRPIVIRVGTKGAAGQIVDPANFPAATITGTVAITGDYNWLRGLALGGVTVGSGSAASPSVNPVGARVNRCELKRNNGIKSWGISLSTDWCEIGTIPGVFLLHMVQFGSLRPFTYRNWFHDGVGTGQGSGTMEMVGTNNDADFVDCHGLSLENLYGPPGDLSEAWESKSNFNVHRRCTVIGAAGQSLRSIVRHGASCEVDTLFGGTNSYVGMRGGPHIFADSTNVDPTPTYWGPFTGNMTYAAWHARAATALDMSGLYPNGVNVTCHRIAKPILGGSPSGVGTPGYPTVAAGTVLLSCTNLPPTIRDGTPFTTGTSTRPLPTKAARNWPQPTGGANDKLGPNGVYNSAD